MKKELNILFILLILCTSIPFILADDAEESDKQISLARDWGAIVQGAEVENVFKREVEAPSIIRFILGIKGEDILTWEKLILTAGAWILFFIVIHSTVSIIPFFIGNEKIQLGVSFIVLMLISMTTGVTYLVDFIIAISDFVVFFDELGPAKIFFGILIIFLGIKALNFISSRAKEKLKMAKAEDAGENFNIGSKLGKVEADAVS